MSQKLLQNNYHPINPIKLDFTIDLSQFSQTIKTNFSTMWAIINKHNEDIQILKTHIKKNININKQQNNIRKDSVEINNNSSLNYSQASNMRVQKQIYGNTKNNKNVSSQTLINPQKIVNLRQNQDIITKNMNKQMKLQNIQGNLIKMSQNNYQQGIVNTNQISKTIDHNQQNSAQQQNANALNFSLIENKILQMNQRLEKMELNSVKQNSNFSKKMNFISSQMDRSIEAISKKQSQIKKLQYLIEKLRGELSQFKLKKQSQIMKMAQNGNGGSSNSSSQFNQFVLQKIQQISLTMPHFVLKNDLQQYKAEQKILLARQQRKLNQTVTNTQFEDLINIISRKKPQKLSVQKLQGQTSKNQSQQQAMQNKLQIQIQNDENQVNPMIQYKLNGLQKQIKQILQYLQNNKKQNQAKLSKNIEENSTKIKQLQKQFEKSQQKFQQYEQFMRKMNESYDEKIKQIINQIVQTQQTVQQLNNQMKHKNFLQGEGGQVNSSTQLIDNGKVIDIDNDINSLKRKVNKIALKIQNFKQDMLNIRQDFSREIDIVKVTLEKKCDWESYKQSFHTFQDRIKQIQNFLIFIQQSAINSTNEGSQRQITGTAAKKGWTCLFCDSNIKQIQSKLSEPKFTSVLPSRYESPRALGYYKQKQGAKQYTQLFLKHNRRLSHANQTQITPLQAFKSKQQQK